MAEKRDTYNNSLAGVLPKDSFLRPEFQARDLDELLDSLLIFDDIMPKQTVDATTFSYQIATKYSTWESQSARICSDEDRSELPSGLGLVYLKAGIGN